MSSDDNDSFKKYGGGYSVEPIAVVGMACRFPGAPTVDDYWKLLIDGVDAITDVPADRWDLEDWYDPDPSVPGKIYNRGGGFIKDVYDFDADFFRIAPKEAISMDPQQRLLLEIVWEALENSGYAPNSLAGSSGGVYLGISTNDYLQLGCRLNTARAIDPYNGTGSATSIASGRISYILGLEGPNYAVDTACSSSLVAVHLACQSLRKMECRFAVCAGVNLILAPQFTVYFCKLGALSPDSRCKAFDASADGYVRGEGCGAVVLKRLADALADGDTVLALIQGSAVNHDGRSSGLTAPSGPAQKALLEMALKDAAVTPGDIDWIEAHGTGTPLGDPIELHAIGSVYRETRSADNPLIVASAKTNIGHLEAAAGIAGLIKVVLAMQHNQIPAHLHFRQPNPYISWNNLPIEIPTVPVSWKPKKTSRMAGLSSFGFSGTNAHLIISEAPPQTNLSKERYVRPAQILCLSAKTEAGLKQFIQQTVKRLDSLPDESFPDVCYTANVGRSPFSHRVSFCVKDRQTAVDGFKALLNGTSVPGLGKSVVRRSNSPKVAFLFAGQGVQYADMGRELYKTQPVFRRAIEECEEVLDRRWSCPLIDVLYDLKCHHFLDQAVYAQLAIFAVEYGLVKLWQSWGVRPDIVLGHSNGEYTAACVAGIIGLEDGLRFASMTRLMDKIPVEGMMVAVQAGERQVASTIEPWADQVVVAAINAPAHTVISGFNDAVLKAVDRFESDKIKCRRLNISHAFHSPLVDPILYEYEKEAAGIRYCLPNIGMVSCLTGNIVKQDEASNAVYWRKQFREPVKFDAGIRTLREHGCDVFIELSPRPVLLPMARECIKEENALWLPSLRPGKSDWTQMMLGLRDLYLKGADINWRGFDGPYQRKIVSFPNYPFQKKRYSNIDSSAVEQFSEAQTLDSTKGHDHGLHRLRSSVLKEDVFQVRIRSDRPSFLNDHRMYDMTIVPGVFYLSLVLTAAMEVRRESPIELSEILFVHPLILHENESVDVQLILSPADDDVQPFRLMSAAVGNEAKWVTHATGKMRFAKTPPASIPLEQVEAFKKNCAEHGSDSERVYKKMRDRGYVYGPSFRWMTEAWQGQNEALVRVAQPEAIDPAEMYALHPGLMDACTQALAFTATAQREALESGAYIPVSIDKIRFRKPRSTDLLIHVSMSPLENEDRKTISADIQLFNSTGETVLKMEGVKHRHAPRKILGRFAQQRILGWLYAPDWIENPLNFNDRETEDEVQQDKYWILFTDDEGVALKLAERLDARGEKTVQVRPSKKFQEISTDTYAICPDKKEHFERILNRYMGVGGKSLQGIVFMWSLNRLSTDETSDFLEVADDLGVKPILYLIQALAKLKGHFATPLWFCTQGVHSFNEKGRLDLTAYAPIWGMTSTVAMEQPNLRLVRIDLDPDSDSEVTAQKLFDELQTRDREDQIAYRGEQRYVQRLRRFVPSAADGAEAPLPDQTYRLAPSEHGALNDIRIVSTTRGEPKTGQVEIEVHATSLNFRDVLNAMNLYPGDAGPLGLECAGRISSVGEGVPFEVGDKVLALAWGCFSKYTITDARLVAPLPPHMTYTDGSTLPITFLTARAALIDLAKISSKDRVLIHAGAGGVGQAAIQIAQQVGAEIFTTAGSPAKRSYLRDLGVQHVFNSRTFDFVDEIKTGTQGKGVDIVLNSLAGDYIPRSLSVLAKGGCFVEIGKIGIWGNEQVSEVRPDVDYHIFALDDLVMREVDTVSNMLRNLMPEFSNNHLQPLRQKIFPIEKADKAFQFMAQAKHIGKIVLTHPISEGEATRPAAIRIRKDSTYLITGGFGGLGLVISRWLVQQGARNIVLMGRRPPSENAQQSIEALKDAGAVVSIQCADVTQRDAVQNVLSQIETELPPLRGIFHAAGVIDDGTITQQDWAQFKKVMAPKVTGAYHLHELTKKKDLELFVMFSSIASLLGSPGQSNYAAGNAFLDALAHYRRSIGLPALSINWGPWQEMGMTARPGGGIGRHWSAMGIGTISLPLGLTALELLIDQPSPQVGVMVIDWNKLIQRFPPDMRPPAIEGLVEDLRDALEPSQEWLEFVEKLRGALPGSRKELMTQYLQDLVVRVLELESSQQIDPDVPLNELGFDSLMAVELANRLGGTAGIAINPTMLFDYPTLGALAGYFVDEILDLEGEHKAQRKMHKPDAPAVKISSDHEPETPKPEKGRLEINVMTEATESILNSIDAMTDEEIDRIFRDSLSIEEK